MSANNEVYRFLLGVLQYLYPLILGTSNETNCQDHQFDNFLNHDSLQNPVLAIDGSLREEAVS
jgi:hypothetical protein